MLFDQPTTLLAMAFFAVAGIAGKFRTQKNFEKLFAFFSTALMAVTLLEQDRFFGLNVLYGLLLVVQVVNFFWRIKAFSNLHTCAVFFLTTFFCLSQKLVYDLSLAGATVVALLMVLSKKSTVNLLIGLLSFLLLFFIFALSMETSAEFSSYETLVVHFPDQYAIGLFFLFFGLFFLVFSLPFLGINDALVRSGLDLKIVLALSVFYYGFLSKLTWVFQNLFERLAVETQGYFSNLGKAMFGLSLGLWFFNALSSKRPWERRFVSLYFLNLSIALLISLSGLDPDIVHRFQWLLLSATLPLTLWSFLRHLDEYHLVPPFYYSLVLTGFYGVPLGLISFSKMLLSLSFYEQNYFWGYLIYLGPSQVVAFWVASEFFTRSKVQRGKLNPRETP